MNLTSATDSGKAQDHADINFQAVTSENKSYTYNVLEEGCIRLLKVSFENLKDGSSILHSSPGSLYEIVHVLLKQSPPFEAVSYVWGDPSRSKELHLPRSKILPITESISEALGFVIQAQRTGYLWVDQICINQEDISERSRQVAIMGSIYRRASCVLVWLGPAFDSFKRANNVFQKYDSDVGNSAELSELVLPEPDLLLRRMLLTDREAFMNRKAIIDIMKLPWFERAWVFQEFTLAQRVSMLAGEFEWDANSLFLVTCRMRDFSREKGTPLNDSEISYLRANHPLQLMVNSITKQEELYFLLSRMAERCKAFDQRDLIYAFLSLNHDTRINITPNYSLSVRDIFIGTARAIINATNTLDIFAIVPRERNSNWRIRQTWIEPPPPVPSWVPNWCYRALSLPLFYPKAPVLFDALGRRPYLPSESRTTSDPDHLVLHGKVVANIHAISPIASGHGSRKSLRSFICLDEQGSALQSILSSLPPTDAQRASANQTPDPNLLTRSRLLRLSIADGAFVAPLSAPLLNDDRAFRPKGDLSDAHIERLLKIYDVETGAIEKDDKEYDELWDRDLWLLHEYALVLRRRRIFVTSDARLGLGQEAARAGDCVAVVYGSMTPLVLREKVVRNGSKFYELLGQCFLEGAMYGGACAWAESETEEIILI